MQDLKQLRHKQYRQTTPLRTPRLQGYTYVWMAFIDEQLRNY